MFRSKFISSDDGTYDVAVYRDTETLAEEGLVCVDRVGRRPVYAATDWAAIRAEAIATQVPSALRQRVSTAAAWVRGLSFRELVNVV